MTTDASLLTRTACGLYVIAGEIPRLWPNFTWTTQVADMPGDQEDRDALSLIGNELMAQAGQNTATGMFVTPRDVAFACLHEGEVERVDHPGLDFADPDMLNEQVARDAELPAQPWTVCGIVEQNWRTFCFRTEAAGPFSAATPLVAYLRAWQWLQDHNGGYLLLAAVHPGSHHALETFGYADPWINDEAAMATKARDEWGVPSF